MENKIIYLIIINDIMVSAYISEEAAHKKFDEYKELFRKLNIDSDELPIKFEEVEINDADKFVITFK